MSASPASASSPLQRVLHPRKVAIVGASSDPRSFGGFVQGNLDRLGFAGEVHLVSRSSEAINGRPCVKTVAELPEGLDVAVLAIPEAGVLDAVQQLAARSCHAAVLFASGYAETGEEGRAKQEALVHAAGHMRLIGPNCMGYTVFGNGLGLTFEPLAANPPVAAAGIGIVAQSGFMAATMRDAFLGRGLNLTVQFSTGNEAGVTVEDVVAAYLADAATRVMAVYAEQLRRPAEFLALAAQAREAGKPIVLLMPGRSARAAAAAASHTGALAGDHATATTLLKREAVVVVDTLDELFDTATILLQHPRPEAGGTAFITGSGAMKNLALDMADAVGLALPELQASTAQALRGKLPSFAVAENPLDYTTIGVRQPGLIGELVHTMAADAGIGQICLAMPVGPVVAQRDKAEHIVPALGACTKPTVLVLTGDNGPVEPFFLQAIQASGVPLFRSADRALRALARVADHAAARQKAQRRAAPAAAQALPAPVSANGIYAEHQGKAWLRALGLPTPAGALATTVDEAVATAQRIGYPVVLKAQASELPHKSDAGGVLVGLQDEAALRAGWSRLFANVAKARPGLVLDGALVEAMGPRGLELVVGARRDAQWGPVLLVGLGGIWIEALKDVRLMSADLSEQDIEAELWQLKAAPLLRGVRGAAGVDVRAIARAVAAVGAQMRANPRLSEIDINPLVAYPNGVLALDALISVGIE